MVGRPERISSTVPSTSRLLTPGKTMSAVHPRGALDMDSGSPGCKLGLPEHAGQALTFGAYVCHLGTREKVPLRDHYKVMCVGPHV